MDLNKTRIIGFLLCAVKSNCLFLLFLFFCHPAFSQRNLPHLYAEIKEMAPDNPEGAEKKILTYIRLGAELRSAEAGAKADYLLGLTSYFRSRFYISNKYYSNALKSEYARKNLAFEGICHNNMGINYEIQNMIPESLDSYQKSLRISEQLKDSVGIGQCWINIGLLNAKTKRFEYAETLTLKAYTFFSRKADTLNMALCYQNLGFIASDEKRSELAIDYFTKCLKLNEAIHHQYEVVSALLNLGCEYAAIDQEVISGNYLKRALKLALEQDRKMIVAKIYIQLGDNYTNTEDYQTAEAYFGKARVLVEYGDIDEVEPFLFLCLANLYAKSGNYEAYVQTTLEFNERNRQQSVRQSQVRVDELQALYEFHRNISKIEHQAQSIATQQRQKIILTCIASLIGIVLLIVLVMHFRMRRYMRSLFENKVGKTAKHVLVSDPGSETGGQRLFELYGRITAYLQGNGESGEKELSVALLASRLHATEEETSEAIRIYGKNESSHVLFLTAYIDDICRQMISRGKAIHLKETIVESPFSSFAEFSKKFKETTGLSPVQFMHYSEQRLKMGVKN